MRIAGLQKLTLLDYPDHTAATVFVDGCNFRCPFCHNAELVMDIEGNEHIPESDFFAFLETRAGLLDGVCITGGEPTLQADLLEFCLRIRKMGFKTKLDTNGSNPSVLEELIEKQALDYVAVDVKNTRGKYQNTCGTSLNYFDEVFKAIAILAAHDIPYELRTTVVRELTDESDLLEIAACIPQNCSWNIQDFRDAPSVLVGEGTLHPWREDELEALLPRLREIHSHTYLRSIS